MYSYTVFCANCVFSVPYPLLPRYTLFCWFRWCYDLYLYAGHSACITSMCNIPLAVLFLWCYMYISIHLTAHVPMTSSVGWGLNWWHFVLLCLALNRYCLSYDLVYHVVIALSLWCSIRILWPLMCQWLSGRLQPKMRLFKLMSFLYLFCIVLY